MKLQKKAAGVYYLSSNSKIDEKAIECLDKKMKEEELDIARICLHNNEESKLMAMIIMIKNRFTYPAHRHTWKDECYTIIKGSCTYVEYSCNGKIKASHDLKTGYTFLNKNKNFHTLLPTSDKLVFLESTIGPFSRSQQLEFL